jgi:[ribosomal protein S5]-alanine N-acetyltransferase
VIGENQRTDGNRRGNLTPRKGYGTARRDPLLLYKQSTFIEVKQKFQFAALEKSPDSETMIWLKWVAITPQNQHVGVVEIGIFDDRYAEIGFMTFVGFQNRGYAKIYSSLAIAQAQQRFNLSTLHASVNEFNIASRKVVEKLGFELYKVNRNAELIKGKFSDEFIYRLTF